MSLNNKKILGVNITIDRGEKILEEVRKCLKVISDKRKVISKKIIKPLIIFTPNPEIIVYGQKDPVFKQIVNTAQINIPDGAGVVWAIKRIHDKQIKRITGADFVLKLVGLASEKTYTIGVIGGRSRLALDASKCLREIYPGVKIEVLGEPEVEIQNSEFRIQSDEGEEINTDHYFRNLVKEIVSRKIDILFVALGFPKQEYFISRLSLVISRWPVGKPLVVMGVGGSLEYIGGRVPRAPEWLQRAGIEWLYRLFIEPWRIKRHIIGSQFFIRVLLMR